MARTKYAQIENKNAIIEILEEGKPLERIYIANNAYKDNKTKRIVQLANEAEVPIERASRRAINRRSKASSQESVLALMHIDNQMSLDEIFEGIYERGDDPFFLIFNDIRYSRNVGAIFRTAFAAGVNGIVTPVEKGNLLTDEVIRISMGTCLRVPIAEMSLFAAIKQMQKNAVEVFAVDMNGESLYQTDLTGPKALILGSEDIGVSSKMVERADKTVSIPMNPGLGSLNVGVSAGIVMYEKLRQDLHK